MRVHQVKKHHKTIYFGVCLQDCVQLNQYKLKDEIGKVDGRYKAVTS